MEIIILKFDNFYSLTKINKYEILTIFIVIVCIIIDDELELENLEKYKQYEILIVNFYSFMVDNDAK